MNFKKYFLELGFIFKSAICEFCKNFTKNTLYIWLLAIAQVILAIPLLFLHKAFSFINLTTPFKIAWCITFIIYLFLFFVMYKKIFKITTNALQKPKLSHSKIIKSLILLGIFNSIPLLAFICCFYIVQFIPQSAQYIKICLNFFTYMFYFGMSLSIAAIANYQDKNAFFAILNSFKIFFKKLKYVIPVFSIFFLLSAIITFFFCTVLYAIAISYNFYFGDLASTIQVVMSAYSLHLIAGLSIGAQIAIIKDYSMDE